MDPVVHFEVPAKDMKRMSAFYEKCFDWKLQDMGKDYGGYVVAHTTEMDENRMPLKSGRINGGFYMATDDPLSHSPSVVISVEDVNASVKKVEAAGGKILRMPEPIPGVGMFCSFQDSEGNRMTMLQPEPMRK